MLDWKRDLEGKIFAWNGFINMQLPSLINSWALNQYLKKKTCKIDILKKNSGFSCTRGEEVGLFCGDTVLEDYWLLIACCRNRWGAHQVRTGTIGETGKLFICIILNVLVVLAIFKYLHYVRICVMEIICSATGMLAVHLAWQQRARRC